ncbi:MAG: hypothetical protein Q4P83_06955 [Spirochaetales bacterium]|nr:hypothetical protein [Spirochaetales bacterium]
MLVEFIETKQNNETLQSPVRLSKLFFAAVEPAETAKYRNFAFLTSRLQLQTGFMDSRMTQI